MDPYDAMDYYKVKDAILAKYEISAESYRARFRDPNIQPGETPREFYNRLKDLYQKWIRPAERTVEEIGEILILEQFLRSLSPEVRVWVKEHNPHTGLKAAELVDSFMAARRGPKDFRFQGISRAPQKGSTHTLVQPHLVKQPEALTGQRLRVCCVNGDEHEYPIAVICLKIHEQTYKLEAGVVKGLRHPVVLGQDVLILPDLVQATLPVSMVATRAQTKRALADESAAQDLFKILPFSQEEICPPEKLKAKKTRRQRRYEKLVGTVKIMSSQDLEAVPKAGEDVWDVPGNLKELQRQDESLKELFSKAVEIDGWGGDCHECKAHYACDLRPPCCKPHPLRTHPNTPPSHTTLLWFEAFVS
ncbi:hypothetical protein ACEWY4_014018 [Coilia grayii]|uniref:SCAN box domain-containing protein n=1 Tax=Coilia grayii TaxID=363190 RepID=A0ABD1JR86_9TELE